MEPTDRRRLAMVWPLARVVLFLGAIAAAWIVGGFLQFASGIAEDVPPPGVAGDGIVALTGGRARIHGALDLLQAGRGRRLLITGVYRGTRPEDLVRPGDPFAALISCCVDLGFEAETTIGNAAEAGDEGEAQA